MDLKELSKKLHPCDMDKPFAFISYCSKDSDVVWNDVYHLQQEGYNLWIDINLKETDDSWRQGALEAIKDIDCKLLIFYMSRSSVLSQPCLEELRCKDSKEAKAQHGGKEIPWIAVEVEEIGNTAEFRETVFNSIDPALPRTQRNTMARTLAELMDEFFPDGDKIRIKCKDNDSKRYDYYQKIEENLDRANISKLSCEELYVKGTGMLSVPSSYESALNVLEYCAEEKTYLPAILMLAFIHSTGVCGVRDQEKAQGHLLWGSFQKDTGEWRKTGDELKQKRRYEEAAAYYSAAGVNDQSPEAYLEAAKMWMRMKNANFEFTKKCAEEAARLNNKDGRKLYEGLKRMSKSKFLEFAKTVN